MTCPHCNPREHYARTVENKTPLFGEWTGWRLAGRWLVAPNGARLLPARVLGYAWEEKRREIADRRKVREQRSLETHCTVIKLVRVTPARERFDGYA